MVLEILSVIVAGVAIVKSLLLNLRSLLQVLRKQNLF